MRATQGPGQPAAGQPGAEAEARSLTGMTLAVRACRRRSTSGCNRSPRRRAVARPPLHARRSFVTSRTSRTSRSPGSGSSAAAVAGHSTSWSAGLTWSVAWGRASQERASAPRSGGAAPDLRAICGNGSQDRPTPAGSVAPSAAARAVCRRTARQHLSAGLPQIEEQRSVVLVLAVGHRKEVYE